LSAAAWEQWKQEKFGDRNIRRSEWFELVDPNLQEINNLVQSSDGDDLKLGLQKLRDRVIAAQQAESNIESASGKERGELLQVIRKGPKLLVTILKCLESDSSRDEGKEKLFDLCDDVVASQTMAREMPISKDPRQTTTARQAEQVETTDEGGVSIMVALAQSNNIRRPPPAPGKSIQPYRPIEQRIATSRVPWQSVTSAGENAIHRPPSGVDVRDFAVEAERQQVARSQRRPQPNQFGIPAVASPQADLYLAGEGTSLPAYFSPSKSFAEYGGEQGVKRPPAYEADAPNSPPAANLIPRAGLGDDGEAADIQI
jgi:hypothetical protein